MLILFGFMLFGAPLFLGVACWMLWTGSITATAIVCLFVLGAFLPRRVHAWSWFILHNPLWPGWRQYFGFQVYKRAGADWPADQRYLLVEEPHGYFPMGQWLSQSVSAQLFPGLRCVKGGGASVLTHIPLVRHVYGWMGIISAGRQSLAHAFQQGYNVCIIPGGIAEMFLVSPNEENLFLQRRRGFIKLALQTGAALVPIYHLGNTVLFSQPRSGAWHYLARLSRALRISLIVIKGRFGLPLPYQERIVMLIGEPIPTVQTENPSSDVIEELHAKFMAEMESLYYQGRCLRPGWADRPLNEMGTRSKDE
jgi:2-acylglycerol O-acyltransferase 2